jgi:hypothetical protein
MRPTGYSEIARNRRADSQPLPQKAFASWCAMTQEQRDEFYSLVNKFLERDGKRLEEIRERAHADS